MSTLSGYHKAMNVQIFGTQKSQETKKALRFFKERGVKPQFVDLGAKKTAPGELKRFVQKVGVAGLIAADSKAYEASGLEYLALSDEALLERLLATPALLKQPLVRSGAVLGVGWDEALWREVYAAAKGG
jgi:arsenate reductase (glutaredoxin)